MSALFAKRLKRRHRPFTSRSPEMEWKRWTTYAVACGGQSPWPDLILLDLNLPRMNGREVLAEVKSDPRLKQIPVVVMTSSHSDDDIAAAYSLNANCYVTKPLELDQYIGIVQSIEDFWCGTAQLPRHFVPSMSSTTSVSSARM